MYVRWTAGLAVVWLAIPLLGTRPAPAAADAPAGSSVAVQGGPGVISVTGDLHQVEDPSNAPPPIKPAGVAPVDPTAGAVLVPQVLLDANGHRCLYASSTSGDGSGAAAANGEASFQLLVRSLPLCPNSPVNTAPAPSPLAAVEYAWRRDVPLPTPAPNIDPGYALTGKSAYLETGDATRFGPVGVQELGYAITLSAVGTYEVVWGDGSTSGPGIASAGGKWPGGDVTHVYDLAGTYRLRVIETWRGHYVVNGVSGDIADAITTEGDLPAFVAHQVQAVLNT